MNSKVVITFEVILIVIYLILVVFIFDTSTTLGLIEVGVLTAVLFPLIIVMEKKREASVMVETPAKVPVEGQQTTPPATQPPTKETQQSLIPPNTEQQQPPVQ